MNERVELSIENHVARVMLDRADKKNAVDGAMFEALTETAESLAGNPEVRVVVIHGAGENFCAGIDTAVFQGEGIGAAAGDAMQARDGSPANYFQSAAYAWRELPVPVIAAIEGYAFGAGMQIALGADIRYASPAAQLSIMEIRWGLIPDMAISTTLRHVMPVDRVRELAYTGRVVNGVEAQQLGLVTSVEEKPLEKAMAVADEIAARSPDAVRAAKRLISEAWELTDAEALRTEARLQSSLMGTPNQIEAVMANLHKRKANFGDPKP
jgi:enoyl-CoA hydratase/carnithine racemase